MNDPKPAKKFASKLTALMKHDVTLLAETQIQQERTLTGIVGVDEVGRGSLIGPVVAAAVAFPVSQLNTVQKKAFFNLDDSKAGHFTHEKRVILAEGLKQHCYWGLGEASKEEVETLNIFHASLLSSRRAIEHLAEQYPECLIEQHLVVIDGKFHIPNLSLAQRAVIKADGISAAVAAASVIAKAHRDAIMIAWANDYPGYGWETNAGYPTPGHKAALQTLGITPLHRKTYQVVREVAFALNK